jgi:hypothetical protein
MELRDEMMLDAEDLLEKEKEEMKRLDNIFRRKQRNCLMLLRCLTKKGVQLLRMGRVLVRWSVNSQARWREGEGRWCHQRDLNL